MLRAHHASPRRAARTLCAVVALLVLLPTAAFALRVDDYAPYQPQTNCSPNAKTGTQRLSTWLQRTYPGSGSMGISRSCRDGGVSEHKEGRAFDWAVNINSSRDRRFVADFFRRIFATDDQGNKHALARRMGIMYLIWNDQIYSSYYGFRARPYRPCRVPSQCSATMRHRNHVHLSLSRAGGAGTTSWYTGSSTVPTPKPTPPPMPTPRPAPAPPPPSDVLDLGSKRFAAVSVPADGSTKVTPFKLRKGDTYKITAAGLFGYGVPAQVADASCRWLGTTKRWTPYPSKAVTRSKGSLNLLVDGTRIAATACHPASHVYTRMVRPSTTRTLRLRVANVKASSSGALTVLVSKPATDVRAGLPRYPALAAAPTTTAARSGSGLISETVSVPASAGTVWSAGALEKGAAYRITVSGSAGLGAGVLTDGRCLAVKGRWYPQVSLDRRFPAADHGKLYLEGAPFTGAPTAGGGTCATRTHALEHTATRTGRLALAVHDPLSRSDDTGSLTVVVQRLTPVATPVAAAVERPTATTPWKQARDSVRVNAGARRGAVSRMRLRAGEVVDVVARGTQRSAQVLADASCVRTRSGWRPSDAAVALRQDPLDLWVDGRRVTWRPVGRSSGCSAGHAYVSRFVAAKNGPVRLTVLDLDYRDNTGALTVTLTRR